VIICRYSNFLNTLVGTRSDTTGFLCIYNNIIILTYCIVCVYHKHRYKFLDRSLDDVELNMLLSKYSFKDKIDKIYQGHMGLVFRL